MSDQAFTMLYLALLLIGASLVVWLMTVIAENGFISKEPMILRQARRVSLAAFAFGLLWAAEFCAKRGWVPTSPDVLIILAIDSYLIIAAISSWQLSRQTKSHKRSGRRTA